VDWTTKVREQFQRKFLDPASRLHLNGDERREVLQVRVEDAGDLGDAVPAPAESFEELGVLPEYMLQALRENGIAAPMAIQAQALPLVLSGCDVIGLAQTGSGKTLAFLLPAVTHIEAQRPVSRNDATPIALVLAPTRELAVQISEEATKALKYSRSQQRTAHVGGLWSSVVYGGGNKREQIQKVRGSHILVATPGRLLDFVSSQIVSLHRATYFVLDEADRMLDMGFHGDVTAISEQVRPERQVLFFSATWSKDVQKLASGLCNGGTKPVRISVGQKSDAEAEKAAMQARKGIDQEVVVVDMPGDWKKQEAEKKQLLESYLVRVLKESENHKVLVFVSQKQLADDLSDKLWKEGIKADAMHGGKQQEQRLWVLDQFKQGQVRLLICTDVLGRGIDIPKVSHVVVFDMGGIEDYVHRIGRTARGMNGKGQALVFFEYNWKDPELAGQLIEVLESSEQPVPEKLRQIAREVQQGKRKVYDAGSQWGGSGGGGGGGGWSSGGRSWTRNESWSANDGANSGKSGYQADSWRTEDKQGEAAPVLKKARVQGTPGP